MARFVLYCFWEHVPVPGQEVGNVAALCEGSCNSALGFSEEGWRSRGHPVELVSSSFGAGLSLSLAQVFTGLVFDTSGLSCPLAFPSPFISILFLLF